jgi:hypothetical protein
LKALDGLRGSGVEWESGFEDRVIGSGIGNGSVEEAVIDSRKPDADSRARRPIPEAFTLFSYPP